MNKQTWPTQKLGEVAKFQSGFAVAKSKSVISGIPHLRTFNIKTSGKLNLSEIVYIPGDLVKKTAFGLKNGDILFNNTNSKELVGKSAIVEKDLLYSFSNHLTRVRVDQKKILPKWLLLTLVNYWQRRYFLYHSVKWIGQAGFSTDKLSGLEIPVPSIEEQKRIVKKLGKILKKIDLTSSLRQESIKEIQKILSTAFNKRVEELSRKAKTLKLGEVLSKIQYGTSARANGGDTPILRMQNIQSTGVIEYSNLKYISLPKDEERKYILNKGDILINRTNSLELVGKSGLFNNNKYLFASYLIRLVADKQKANPKFINYWLNSKFGREYIQKTARQTAGQANINSKEIAGMPILLPDLKEQEKIVACLDGLSEKVKRLQELQKQTQQELELLTQSVLHQAFQGKL